MGVAGTGCLLLGVCKIALLGLRAYRVYGCRGLGFSLR